MKLQHPTREQAVDYLKDAFMDFIESEPQLEHSFLEFRQGIISDHKNIVMQYIDEHLNDITEGDHDYKVDMLFNSMFDDANKILDQYFVL